jgi:hypothetical protein
MKSGVGCVENKSVSVEKTPLNCEYRPVRADDIEKSVEAWSILTREQVIGMSFPMEM